MSLSSGIQEKLTTCNTQEELEEIISSLASHAASYMIEPYALLMIFDDHEPLQNIFSMAVVHLLEKSIFEIDSIEDYNLAVHSPNGLPIFICETRALKDRKQKNTTKH